MANSTSNTGLVPLKIGSDANYAGQFHLYYHSAAEDLLIGDPVKRAGTCNTARVETADEVFEIGKLPTVVKATAGATNYITGAVIGFKPVVDSLYELYKASGNARVVMVADDPDIVFGIRDYGAAAAIGVAAVGLNAVIKYGTDNTNKTCSGVRLDDGTTTAPAADATYQFRIVGCGDSDTRIKNDPTAAGAVWKVMINLHTERQGALGL